VRQDDALTFGFTGSCPLRVGARRARAGAPFQRERTRERSSGDYPPTPPTQPLTHDDRRWMDPSPGSEASEVDLGGIRVRVACIRGSTSEGSELGSHASEVDLGGIQAPGLMHRRSTSEGSKLGSHASEVDVGGIQARVACIGGRRRRDPSSGRMHWRSTSEGSKLGSHASEVDLGWMGSKGGRGLEPLSLSFFCP
jgi:hypothetical protein